MRYLRNLVIKQMIVWTPGVVRSYIAEGGTLIPCEPDEFGMAMPVFDETINSINRAASKIATRIVLEAEGE